MKQILSRYWIVCALIFYGCIFACRKSGPDIQTPRIDKEAILSMTKPSDSTRFSPEESINISGKVTGSQSDYSFLKYYVLNSGSHDTLATGEVAADGSIDAEIKKTPLPGQYHIYLKAVNKSPDTRTLSSNSRLIIVDGLSPLILAGDSISLTLPADSARFTMGQQINISGQVTGSQKDYSFLNYYVLRSPANDTLLSGNVSADGSIHSALLKNPSNGQYHIYLKAVNKNADTKTLSSNNRVIFVGGPPPLKITGFINDNTSITMKWTMSQETNFKSYQVFVSRTDTGSVTPPFPPGKLLATIQDINQITFNDNGVSIGYQYRYVIRQNTQDGVWADSDPAVDSFGGFFTLRGQALPFFDQVRNRIYHYSPDSSSLLLTIDPDLLTVENATDIGSDKVLLGMDETGNNLNLVVQQVGNGLTDSAQLFKFDLITHTLKAQGKFQMLNSYPIIAVSNNYLFYTQGQFIVYTDMTNGSSFNTLLQKAFVGPMQTFNNNADMLIHFANNRQDPWDSFYIYHISPGNIQLTYRGVSSGFGSFVQKVIPFYWFWWDGPNVYDQSFLLQGSLPGTNFITGISQDEKYVASSSNQIYRISDWSVAQTLSTGLFMPYVFFKTDGTKIYPVTAPFDPSNSYNSYKIYSYPWGK